MCLFFRIKGFRTKGVCLLFSYVFMDEIFLELDIYIVGLAHELMDFKLLLHCYICLFTQFLDQIKFSELTLDTFRMLQCLEWEPSGSFYQSTGTASGIVHKGASGPSRINYAQDIADPTLPVNPRKAMLYRPSATHFIAVSIFC